MRLAEDEITISLPPKTFVLRATLRAAFQLNKSYGGFSNLAQAISAGSVVACCDIIKHACLNPQSLSEFVRTLEHGPLADAISGNREQFLEFVLILSGARHDVDAAQPGEPITFDEYHTKLFQIGTGWLGWTPEDTWECTAAEIINAQTGRLAMLAAIFGNGKGDTDEEIDTKDSGARAELNALGDLSVHSMNRVRQCQ